MCTLIVGLGIVGPGTLLIGANRDESPGRPSAGPALLRDRPPVAGGRDLVAGGTWLAVREGRFVTALLNRRPPGGALHDPASFRSRGLLCLEAAASGPGFDEPETIDPGTGERYPARLDAALRLIGRGRYAPCSLVGLEADGPSWVVSLRAEGAPGTELLAPGWHVITHEDLDDDREPRTRWLRARLKGEAPADVDQAFTLLASLLRSHGEDGTPPVCLHRERFPTVSSTFLALGRSLGDRARYAHAAGPPCVTPYDDYTPLLHAAPMSREGTAP